MRRRLLSTIPYAMLLLALALRVVDPAPIQQARLIVFDTYQRLAPQSYDPALPVRIVDIDDASIARLGQWPWPRTVLARMVERLGTMGAATVAFDIVFAEPDRSSPEQILSLWPDTPEVSLLRDPLRMLPRHDDVFADAMGRARVVTGFILVDGRGASLPEVRAGVAVAGDDPLPFVPDYAGAVVNLPELEAAAQGNGALNWVPDRDQVIRRLPLVFRMGETLYPSFAAEALRVAQGAGTYVVKASGASGETAFGARTGLVGVRIGNFEVPTDAHGRVPIRFTRSDRRRYIPAWQVLEADFEPERVAGLIVLVGTSAAGLFDVRATPLDAAIPGVEVHAQLIEQIIAGGYLERPDFMDMAEVAYMLVLGLALILLLRRAGAAWVGALGAVATASVVAASWFSYDALGWLVDPLFPSLIVLVAFLFETMVEYLRSEAERRQIRGAFGRYMSPVLVEQLAEHPERLRLGGEMREMTLLFCDIRDFTTISEQFDAEALTAFINRFLTPMTEVIMEARGTIDKYMGDCIMAFWNAPLDDAAHAEHGCRAALGMAARLDELNARWRAEAEARGRDHVPVRVGIGVNTGVCCVGNMGSEQRFDYSVLGDDVNLASRLEGQTKVYGVDIIIGENTERLVPGLATLELDTVRVKGKTRPVRVFALLGDESMAASPDFVALRARNAEMLEAFRWRRWDAVPGHIRACRELAGGRLDRFYDYYLERLETYVA